MATTSKRQKSEACVVRVSAPGDEDFWTACGRPAAQMVGSSPMCEHHATAVAEARPRGALSGEGRRRSDASLSEAASRVAVLPGGARAEARPGRSSDDYAPRVEVDAEWLAGLWSQLDAVEPPPIVA